MVVLSRLGPPSEGIRHTREETTVFVNEKSLGKGTLYISEARVSWIGEHGQGFSLEYPHIAMHAVQKDLSVFPHENLYLIIDVRLMDSDGTPTPSGTPNDSDNDEGEESLGDDDKGMTEIRFVPADSSKLQEMFMAMSECQALHPDPADDSEEENEEEAEDEEEDDEGGENNGHDADMFEDAENDDTKPSLGHRGDEPMEEDAQH